MPLISIITTGFIFHLRNMNNIAKNINNAVQLSVKKSKLDLLSPYNANNIIVHEAEIIKPNEADFNPFNTSNT